MKCPICRRETSMAGKCGTCILREGDNELTRTLFSIASYVDVNDLPNPYDYGYGETADYDLEKFEKGRSWHLLFCSNR